MNDKLTQKQENFVLNLFKGMSQREAYVQAGYSSKSAPSTIDRHACELAKSDKVLARWEALQEEAKSAAIATVDERKERLTEILRADIPDYITEDGIKVSKDSPNVGAVSEITTRTKVFRKTGDPVNITNLKLHSPITAIAELNKMEKIYSEGSTVNIDNRRVEIVFQDVDVETQKMLRDLAGEE